MCLLGWLPMMATASRLTLNFFCSDLHHAFFLQVQYTPCWTCTLVLLLRNGDCPPLAALLTPYFSMAIDGDEENGYFGLSAEVGD
jgi:hypothetical protein